MKRSSTQSIGPYPVLKRVSTGGVANLYLARDPGSAPGEGPVAVRVLSSAVSEDELLCRVLQEQVTIALGFEHPNVAPVLSWNKEGARLYIARPWIDGLDLESLSATIRQHAGLDFPLLQALYIARKAAEGLAYIHDAVPGRGAVHRGVTPRNLILTGDGSVVLTDFGIWPVTWRNAMSISGWGQRRLPFLSPEEAALQIGLEGASEERVGPAADVFALGACLHTLVHGTDVYGMARGTLSPLKALGRVRNWEGWKPPVETETRVPAQLHRLLYRLLARNPADRPQNGREAEEQIAKCLHHLAGDADEAMVESLGDLVSMASRSAVSRSSGAEGGEAGRAAEASAQASKSGGYPHADTEITQRPGSERRSISDATAVAPSPIAKPEVSGGGVSDRVGSDETLVDVSPPFTSSVSDGRDLNQATLDTSRDALGLADMGGPAEGDVLVRNEKLRRVEVGEESVGRPRGPIRSPTQIGDARALAREHSQWDRQVPRVRAPLPPVHASWTFRFLVIAVMVLALLCVVLVHLAREKDRAIGQVSHGSDSAASVVVDDQSR
jgi:serine/threonine protein kinase